MEIYKIENENYYLLAEYEKDSKVYVLLGNVNNPYDQFIRIKKDNKLVALESEEEVKKVAHKLLEKLESSL